AEMWGNNVPALILEGGLGSVFAVLLVYLVKKLGIGDVLLWALVWCTRVFASLNGLRRLPEASPELPTYLGLQACSAIALIVVLLRSEFRIFHEAIVRAFTIQLLWRGK
ncbi:MAG TPA: hypothetical protein VLE22_10275, partial [Bryobacteraceae bacterium]|nr:hypothetical protein [Bryobacteraceae bacterium]